MKSAGSFVEIRMLWTGSPAAGPKRDPKKSKGALVMVNLPGHGDKDAQTVTGIMKLERSVNRTVCKLVPQTST